MASTTPKLSHYKVLMFDVYGTLVDCENGIKTALQPIVAETSLESKAAGLHAFESVETNLQARYSSMREGGSMQTAVQAGAKEVGSTEVGSSASAESTEKTDAHVAFGKSIANWPRMRQDALRRVEEELNLGVESDEVMVVANSVFHDVMSARKMGLGTAWIERKRPVIGHDQEEGAQATFRCSTLGEMAEVLMRELGKWS
ncbi:uncharacterized protein LAESUDRAFT_751406 [Laetiporus sulphureus 93-53]|uniref:HAD-like protein n=1 Tax=Laetiporus sulphureus 93-53 TaxID=1314785 RepID=A0A165CYB5_9APHY|nr:uncharacterized protein LAESUDRAFT_751406 [Laetiporus sulphureus 93-53]KZT03736.1 hypothetical protein LAESUDRAFT_751406 [Laetiporus sulphureus 93-53]